MACQGKVLLLLALTSLSAAYDFSSVQPTEITDEFTDGPDAISSLQLRFIDQLYDMNRNIGKSARLSCRVLGEPPLNLYIYHDRIETFKQKQKKRNLPCETIYDPLKPNELAVVYNIESVQEKHAGVYKCQAESITGEVAVSSMTLTLMDPCEGVVCGFREQCINVKGVGICSCDFPCGEEYDPVCADGVTFSSMCHLQRSECRWGAYSNSIEAGTCEDVPELPTIATCSITGEGHVSKFNGDYFTFRGTCPYRMVEDTRGGTFIVYAFTEACGDNTAAICLRSITIYVDRIYGFSIERGWLINDNGRRRNVMNGEQIILGGGAVSITRVGKTMVGRIENKQIEFFYDGLNYFKLSVPLDFVSKHNDFSGFCGQIPVDFIPGLGRDITYIEDIEMPALGEDDVCRPTFGGLPCQNSEFGPQIRDAFNDEALAGCDIPLDIYITRATQDTCTCDHTSSGTNYCFCNILYSYAEDCRQAGFDIDFSAGDLCAKSYHKDVFKSEGVNYNRRKWYYAKRGRKN